MNHSHRSFGSFVNALVVLTDTPSFPDSSGLAQSLPEDFVRREVP
jgi:hypothetical protein